MCAQVCLPGRIEASRLHLRLSHGMLFDDPVSDVVSALGNMALEISLGQFMDGGVPKDSQVMSSV